MESYRVYAKLLGPLLPKDAMKYDDCVVRPMSLLEQKKRKFKPLEEVLSKWDHKTYITHKRLSDPRIIKTKHVIYTDVNSHEPNYAREIAIERFEKITGALSISSAIYHSDKYNKKIDYQNYEYQIVKIYSLVNGVESTDEITLLLSNSASFLDIPSENDLTVLNERFLSRMLSSEDDVFWKSLEHLQSGQKGFRNNIPPEMMTLEFMKSIELIIRVLHPKSVFKKALKSVAKTLKVDDEDVALILKLWKLRNEGDVAHAKRGPKKFGPYIDSGSLAVRFLVKYFLFLDSLISIKISKEHEDALDELIEVRRGNSKFAIFSIRPRNKNRKKLTPFLKRKISFHFEIPIKDIELYGYQLPYIYFRVVDYLRYDLSARRISKRKIVIFGNI